jgi:hypothetical protein
VNDPTFGAKPRLPSASRTGSDLRYYRIPGRVREERNKQRSQTNGETRVPACACAQRLRPTIGLSIRRRSARRPPTGSNIHHGA